MSSETPAFIQFGVWKLPSRQGATLEWWPDCGALCLEGPKGTQLLAIIKDESQVRMMLRGWTDHCEEPGGLEWVAQQLENAGVR